MRTIASTTELQHELSQILDYTQGEKPSRRRIARDLRALSQRVASLSYPMRVENLQSMFVGECGHELYTWLSGLHQQLARSFDSVSGFQNWDYGDPHSNGGVWSIRVYLKDSPVFQTLAGIRFEAISIWS